MAATTQTMTFPAHVKLSPPLALICLSSVDAVTGATVSSLAATKAARKAVRKIIERTAEAYGG